MLPTEKIDKAVEILKTGGIILHPTDTIWGLGCDPFNEKAIQKIQQIKKRPADQPFILLVHSIEMLKKYVLAIHPRVETLLSLHERPLTIVYPKVQGLNPPLVNKKGQGAFRIVNSGVCHDLLKKWNAPLLSTSANVHGEDTPTHFGEISSSIIRGSDFTFPFSREEKNGLQQIPSTIATFDEKNGDLEFLRSTTL